MMKMIQLMLAIVMVLGVPTTGLAQTFSDTDKEQRWAEQVLDTLFDGEPVWLQAAGHEFLGIEMESETAGVAGANRRAVIVVHGIGVHPNWDQVIRPLRVGLTDYGWHTLSIQMPILLNEATGIEYAPLFDEVTGRFGAAIDHLQNLGFSEIAIIAHSLGAAMTMRYLSDDPNAPVAALVLIGMQGGYERMVHDNVASLRKVRIPVLEVYGSNDLPGVRQFAARKASAAYTGQNRAYRQMMVDGANHFFDDREELLVQIVGEWLDRLEGS